MIEALDFKAIKNNENYSKSSNQADDIYYTLMFVWEKTNDQCTPGLKYNNQHLFSKVEVNSGGYLPSCKAARKISITTHWHWEG